MNITKVTIENYKCFNGKYSFKPQLCEVSNFAPLNALTFTNNMKLYILGMNF